MEIPKTKFPFYFNITNILIIFIQNRYIEVFDLTNPRYNERIFSVLDSSLNRGPTVIQLKTGAVVSGCNGENKIQASKVNL